jgi:NAD(P)-dependent dehydrogenase (short-subunit alcohol dehydrogenase family)
MARTARRATQDMMAHNTIVVTGAGSGVGRSVAVKFAAAGWNVALVGRRAGPLEDTTTQAPAEAAARTGIFPCDVSDAEAVAAMAAGVIARFGHVDVLVNSAGINVPQRSFATLSLDDWHTVVDTNLNGAYYCVRAFLPAMRERQNGTIVNINSDVGKIARELAGPAYVSSKFGLMGLTQQINAEERRNGIRACSICPRDVNTPLLDKRPQPPAADARARMLQPEDLAECVWLAATLPHRVVLDEISLSSR